MNYDDLIRPHLLNQSVYKPGRPIEHVARDYGLDPDSVIKLASNENPLGPSPLAQAAAQSALENAHFYPDGDCWLLREKVAAVRGIEPEELIFGCGSNEIFEFLGHLFLGPGVEVVMGAESFPVYKLITLMFNAHPVEVPMPDYKHDLKAMLAAITPRTRLVFLPSPNNPTGTANTAKEIYAFVRQLPEHVVFVFDEAYAEYLKNPPDLRPFIKAESKIICTRTFSKIYGLAALRLGYGYGSKRLMDLLNRVRQPFNVNGIAQSAGLAAIEDDDFLKMSRRQNRRGLVQLTEGLQNMGLDPVPSKANFLLVKIPQAEKIVHYLQTRGVIVRIIPSFPDHLRISVGTATQNSKLLEALSISLEG